MKTLTRELQDPEKLVEAIRESEVVTDTGQWPRDSYILGLAQVYEVRNDVPRTVAIQVTLEVIRQMAFRFAIRLWEQRMDNPIENGR